LSCLNSLRRLAKLAKRDPVKARLVELRFFAGLKGDQAAEIVGISARTADRYWVYARAWLRGEMDGAFASEQIGKNLAPAGRVRRIE
jgi:DNA-directed RNA polymerase specialized sigma24 family protein